MDTFREWGGYWNVTPKPPGDQNDSPDSWSLRVHSHPFTHGLVAADTVEEYIENPADETAQQRWIEELRPIFEEAKSKAG
jgi:hypothetical protein